jgi:hypothetical protein
MTTLLCRHCKRETNAETPEPEGVYAEYDHPDEPKVVRFDFVCGHCYNIYRVAERAEADFKAEATAREPEQNVRIVQYHRKYSLELHRWVLLPARLVIAAS